MDVPEETKIFKNLTQDELDAVLKEFKPVLLTHRVIDNEKEFSAFVEKFKNK